MPITPINAEIPLQGINPVTTFKDLASANDLQSQMSLRQQQQRNAVTVDAQNKLALEQTQKDQADQQTLQQHMGDPLNQDALRKGDLSGLYGKVQPKTIVGLQNALVESQKNAALLDKDTLANNATRHDSLQKGIDGLLQLPEDQRAAAYGGMVQSMKQSGLLKGIDLPDQLPDYTDKNLNQVAGVNSVYGGIYDAAMKRKGEQAKTDQAAAETTKAQAETAAKNAGIPTTIAEGKIKTAQAANMSTEGLLPEEQAKQAHEKAQLVHEDAALADTAAYHKGELGLKAAANDRENKIFDATYGSGANPALQGVEKSQRSAAAAQAQKAGLEYNQAQAAADEMKSIIDLARSGNKVAYSYAPTTGVFTINSANGVKRVNMAEIHSYAGAGSALDKVEGFLGKQISGASIPPDVLNDMEKLHAQLSSNSFKSYTDKLQTTNNVYRSNFLPATPPPKEALPPPPPAIKVGDLVMYNGANHKVKAVRPDGKVDLEP